MIYAGYEYYNEKYVVKETVIPEECFPVYAKKAGKLMDRKTFDRITADLAEKDDIKDCCCEVAEELYRFESARDNKSGALLASYSNDGVSGSFDITNSEFTKEKSDKRISNIIIGYLQKYGLLYRGL